MARFGMLKYVAIVVVMLLLVCEVNSNENNNDNRLILISMDGFRWDYFNGRARTPAFDSLKKRGVYARKGIQSVFVTNTLPNHFSLVTGLYVENHGMMDNSIFDSEMDQVYWPVFYHHDAVNDPDWLKTVGEPIWVSNQIQKHGRSGVLMWMGGETAIRGVRPQKFMLHTYEMDEMTETNLLVDWLTDLREPIDLAVVYFPEPDATAHLYGPESAEVTKKIEALDKAITHLINKLEEYGLSNTTDVIITSDHGFTSFSPEHSIQIDDILDPLWYKTVSFLPGPVMSIFPNEGMEEVVYSKLMESADSTGVFHVYKSRDIPERFHYKGHRRVPPIYATATLGFSFVNREKLPYFSRLKGNHGYDNQLQQMKPFFVAFGPSFKEDFSVETFPNVDIYPLMCHIKGINPAPNNGSMAIVSSLLRHYKSDQSDVREWATLSLAACCVVAVMVSMVIVAILLKQTWSRNIKRD